MPTAGPMTWSSSTTPVTATSWAQMTTFCCRPTAIPPISRPPAWRPRTWPSSFSRRPWFARFWSSSTLATRAQVPATWPREVASPGVFAAAFAHAIDDLATAAYAPPDLAVGAVVGVLNRYLPAYQRARLHVLGALGEPPPFLPNPRYQPRLAGLDLETQRWIREQRAEDLRTHFEPRGRGSSWRPSRARSSPAAARFWGSLPAGSPNCPGTRKPESSPAIRGRGSRPCWAAW